MFLLLQVVCGGVMSLWAAIHSLIAFPDMRLSFLSQLSKNVAPGCLCLMAAHRRRLLPMVQMPTQVLGWDLWGKTPHDNVSTLPCVALVHRGHVEIKKLDTGHRSEQLRSVFAAAHRAAEQGEDSHKAVPVIVFLDDMVQEGEDFADKTACTGVVVVAVSLFSLAWFWYATTLRIRCFLRAAPVAQNWRDWWHNC